MANQDSSSVNNSRNRTLSAITRISHQTNPDQPILPPPIPQNILNQYQTNDNNNLAQDKGMSILYYDCYHMICHRIIHKYMIYSD